MGWIWGLWATAVLGTFGVIEHYGLDWRERGHNGTLSFYVAWLGAKFPLTIFFIGLFVGGLAVHFWWHYCPNL